MMNNSNNNNNPIQQLQILLNNLNNYINQVNSIIIEMNNIFNQINNFYCNPINQNFVPKFNNNNINFNANNFIMNLENQHIIKPKINALFDVKPREHEIKKYSSNNIINLVIDSETSINELLSLFFTRIGKTNNVNELKNKFSFLINGHKLDFNDQKKVVNMLNIDLINSSTPHFTINVIQT